MSHMSSTIDDDKLFELLAYYDRLKDIPQLIIIKKARTILECKLLLNRVWNAQRLFNFVVNPAEDSFFFYA